MFARIAGRYDLLNHVLSMGIDRSWRAATVAKAAEARRLERVSPGVERMTVVDVCCGTGDLALAFAERGARVVGIDFTPQMLSLAVPKAGAEQRVLFATGDGQRLPVATACADAASVAFGIRNQADPVVGLREMARIVKPGGLVLVLEFSPPPRGPVGAVYRSYFTRVLPLIGGWISGDREAYRYLPRTVTAWPEPDGVAAMMGAAGLEDCGWRSFTLGVACLHWGRVPARRARPGG